MNRVRDIRGVHHVRGDVDRHVIGEPLGRTGSLLQLAGVSQLLSPALPVQVTAESSVRSSIHSNRGLRDRDRVRTPLGRKAHDRPDMEMAFEKGGDFSIRLFVFSPFSHPGICGENGKKLGANLARYTDRSKTKSVPTIWFSGDLDLLDRLRSQGPSHANGSVSGYGLSRLAYALATDRAGRSASRRPSCAVACNRRPCGGRPRRGSMCWRTGTAPNRSSSSARAGSWRATGRKTGGVSMLTRH